MPVAPTYPGVYIEEIPSGVRTIAGVSTARTAFVGRALSGPLNDPTIIFSFADYERIFGGLWSLSSMSFAVQQYFQNGGGEAVIVRAYVPPTSGTGIATFGLTGTVGTTTNATITLDASSPGAWAQGLAVAVNHDTREPTNTKLVNLIVVRPTSVSNVFDTVETLRNVSLPDLKKTLEQRSQFLRFTGTNAPDALVNTPATTPVAATAGSGSDGGPIAQTDIIGAEAGRTGMFALEKTDIFNILCLPPPSSGNISDTNFGLAADYCARHRAMLIVDPPSGANVTSVQGTASAAGGASKRNAALFFPRLLAPNPLTGMIDEFVPCGAVAGIFARTDAQRGVWKAPAGVDAVLSGVQGLSAVLTDGENGLLNQKAVNCLRIFPIYGPVVWGARTLDGADEIGSEWKYIPVRRLALYIEESLFRGLKWVVFEPNDEPLWAQIRLNVGAFMNNLFRQGAFQGAAPKDAYFVHCDKTTTTQNDIDRGIVNIVVGFAPLKPAEFVIIKIQQMAGQIQT